MKVQRVEAQNTDVMIYLELENPAEIAILRLLQECDAKCADIGAPGEQTPPDGTLVRVTVKKSKNW